MSRNALIVLAHPEPKSLNAQLAAAASETLTRAGWSVELSDLYAEGFDPAESPRFFPRRADPDWFRVADEQSHADVSGATDPWVRREQDRLDRADLLILQFPFWWYMAPAMLKGWFDRVLTNGGVYSSRQRFDTGRFRGKSALISVTLGSTAASYRPDGRNGDIDLLLWPVQFSLHYVGYRVLEPSLAYVPDPGPAEVADCLAAFQGRLARLDQLRTVPFNGPEDWVEDRLKPTSASHSLMSRQLGGSHSADDPARQG